MNLILEYPRAVTRAILYVDSSRVCTQLVKIPRDQGKETSKHCLLFWESRDFLALACAAFVRNHLRLTLHLPVPANRSNHQDTLTGVDSASTTLITGSSKAIALHDVEFNCPDILPVSQVLASGA